MPDRLHALLFVSAFMAISLAILYGARRRWRWLVDPPEWCFWSTRNHYLFGQKFVLIFTYTFGVLGTIGGLIGLMNVLSMTTGQSGNINLEVAENVVSRAPSHAQIELENHVRNIATYLNVSGISILTLVGVQKGWFLRGNPPRLLEEIFKNIQITQVLKVFLVIVILVSTVMVYPYIRELGHALGYWR